MRAINIPYTDIYIFFTTRNRACEIEHENFCNKGWSYSLFGVRVAYAYSSTFLDKFVIVTNRWSDELEDLNSHILILETEVEDLREEIRHLRELKRVW